MQGERKSVAAVVYGNLNQRQSTDSFAVNGFKRVKTVCISKNIWTVGRIEDDAVVQSKTQVN